MMLAATLHMMLAAMLHMMLVATLHMMLAATLHMVLVQHMMLEAGHTMHFAVQMSQPSNEMPKHN
jgi:hypothetical protein